MFRLTIVFLVVAIVAAIFGFGGIAASAVGAAKIVFFIAVVLFIISLIMGGYKRS
ncbi:DUF1328 domain-containing protein [Crocinitomix catalasitica]|uniref:DUF1328 domain-containing protein n=1 Tax=Crocinitomix catalasitica TaxID=184607 RepID=UPI000488D931|nr:DUF1328 domain-containing protein [Crocinitomix catalasitica]|tara:strand:- start:371 stop:535 length:165 start_codon:yes stop_codon:yes gene_type:complete